MYVSKGLDLSAELYQSWHRVVVHMRGERGEGSVMQHVNPCPLDRGPWFPQPVVAQFSVTGALESLSRAS